MSTTALPKHEQLPPSLPVERFKTHVYLRSIFEHDIQLRAQRHMLDEDRPDTIAVSSYYGPNLSVEIGLTPAMVVHMANTLLTDAERGAILGPTLAGDDTE